MTDQTQAKREVVDALLKNKILVTATTLQKLNDPAILQKIKTQLSSPGYTTSQILDMLNPEKALKQETSQTNTQNVQTANVEVLWNYEPRSGKRQINDYTQAFTHRYRVLEAILRQRQELNSVLSISRLKGKNERETVSIIGLVVDKQETKNHNYILTIEDPTGIIKAIVGTRKQELVTLAKDIQLDEVIGITGMLATDAIFANSIAIPDIPLTNELKKSSDEACICVVPDIHIGSRLFCKQAFEKFIAWLNNKYGTEEQRKLAQKIRYVFIVGDTVDGIGVYPGHETELEIRDLYEQYETLSAYLRQIPQHIQIILCPGDHDAVRLAEPMPKLDPDFSKSIYTIPNITLVSNPARVRIHRTNDFPGFNVLMYHGVSFTHYADVVESIKNSGLNVSERTELVLRYLLQRRHLAPTYGSTQYIPEINEDALTIDAIPDIMLSGHIHKLTHSTYRGVSLISGGCFQKKTLYQQKFGHEPDPGWVPVLNLGTRQITIMKFDQEQTSTTPNNATISAGQPSEQAAKTEQPSNENFSETKNQADTETSNKAIQTT